MTADALRSRFPHCTDAFIRANADRGNALDKAFRPASPTPTDKTPQTRKKRTSNHAPATIDDRSKAPGAVTKPSVCNESLWAAQREGSHTGRIAVRITSVRKRLLDSDNLVAKFFVDGLRYARILYSDAPEHVEITTTQRKPVAGEEEHTVIDLIPIP